VQAVAADRDVDAAIIPIEFTGASGINRLPGLRTWSWRASTTARDALRAELARGPLDAVFMHTQVLSLLAGQIMRAVPTVVSLDATPRLFDREGEAYGHHRMPETVEMIKRRLNMRAFSSAARLVTWCRWAAYSLVADYGVPADKIDVIPPGVNLEIFRPLLLPRKSAPVRILFVGGDFERKGGPDLLDAARGLGDGVHIDIVTGTDDVSIPFGVAATVHRGLKPQSEKLVQLYRSADIFALPSRGDCMPQAIAEALACGLPVVATSVGAIPEMVTDAVNGYLVKPRSPRGLAAAIAALVNSPRQRHTMGRWSRQMALQDHDAARNNARILGLMKRLAAARLKAVS
jgi:glycosyltransferase involved in cell wall biosynthesis